jgi:integrase
MPPEADRPTRQLSDAALRAAKPGDKPYKLAAGGGLYLEVTPNGSKLWRWKYRLAGKENRFAIGAYPDISLKHARDKRDDARQLVESGIHPSHQKRITKAQHAVEHFNTFEAVSREWLNASVERWVPRVYSQRKNLLESTIFPEIGSLPIRQVTSAHVLKIIKKIEATAPAMAVVGLRSIGAISRLAVSTLRADVDPTAAVRGSLKPRKVKHHRPLTAAELRAFLLAIDESRASFITKIALSLMLLTLARSRELIGALWSEIELEAGRWVIPAGRMKMREQHVVPLPVQAIELLKRLHAVTGHRLHLFPNRDRRDAPASDGILHKTVAGMEGFKDFSPHGIRSTASTMLNDIGFRADLIEKQLAHEQRSQSRRAYDRSTLIDERGPMMQHWANYLDELSCSNKVVPLRKAVSSN